MKNIKLSSLLKFLFYLFVYTLMALSILLLCFVIVSKKNQEKDVSIFGYQVRMVISESMDHSTMSQEEISKIPTGNIPSLPLKSMIFIQTIDEKHPNEWYESLKVGDVITFKYVYMKQETITHRLIDKKKVEDGFILTFAGDNQSIQGEVAKQIIDTRETDSPNYVIGKVVYKNVFLGKLFYLFNQPIGIGCILILPSIIIIILEIMKIMNAFHDIKKNQQEDEINLLKKRIETLQKGGEK